ncbi:MAG TPA: hypothetical protein PKD64_01890 [Pirellulaceae bacterium]|nr:hypothetical protein [Pirellulaceae bacterium]HMO90922.1 hypothetical protein [Pirellulaceae bacterium]HMP68602.1 hypothetical protein [Pirellulaceae bacterium]
MQDNPTDFYKTMFAFTKRRKKSNHNRKTTSRISKTLGAFVIEGLGIVILAFLALITRVDSSGIDFFPNQEVAKTPAISLVSDMDRN